MANPSLLIPSASLVLRPDGLCVATVDAQGNAHFTHIVIGRDLGVNVEVLDGLRPDQGFVATPPDSLVEGEPVRVVSSAKTAASKGSK